MFVEAAGGSLVRSPTDRRFVRLGVTEVAFQLRADEKANRGIARAARKQLKSATSRLSGLPSGDVVHDIRRRLKRVRALVRLADGSLGEKYCRQINRWIRDAGKPLNQLRDADVLMTALEKLVGGRDRRFDKASLAAVRAGLVRDRASAVHQSSHNAICESIAKKIRRARRAIDPGRFSSSGMKSVRRGLAATFGHARDAFRAALVDPSIANLHEWRKQAKYLANQVEFLRPLRPNLLRSTGESLDKLGELLGDDHDLAVLAQTVAAKQHDWQLGDVAEKLLLAIRERRMVLQQQAIALGQKVFSQPADGFVDRIRHAKQRSHQGGVGSNPR
jgi:CHAD domain-containing protein